MSAPPSPTAPPGRSSSTPASPVFPGEGRLPATVLERRPGRHQELRHHRLRPRRPHRLRVLALGGRRHPRHRHRTARRCRRRHRLGPARDRLPTAQRRPRGPLHRRRPAGRTRHAPLLHRGARPRCRNHRRPRRRHPRRPRLHHGQPHPRPRDPDRHRRDFRLTRSHRTRRTQPGPHLVNVRREALRTAVNRLAAHPLRRFPGHRSEAGRRGAPEATRPARWPGSEPVVRGRAVRRPEPT